MYQHLTKKRCVNMQGHLLPVANLALHPSKPILATASDDKTWKLWHLPAGDLIMCGEGHRCVALGTYTMYMTARRRGELSVNSA